MVLGQGSRGPKESVVAVGERRGEVTAGKRLGPERTPRDRRPEHLEGSGGSDEWGGEGGQVLAFGFVWGEEVSVTGDGSGDQVVGVGVVTKGKGQGWDGGSGRRGRGRGRGDGPPAV